MTHPNTHIPRRNPSCLGIGCGIAVTAGAAILTIGTIAAVTTHPTPTSTATAITTIYPDPATPAPIASTQPGPPPSSAPVTTSPTTAPAVASTRPGPPPTHHATSSTSTPVKPPIILTPSGNHYHAGEYCPETDAGLTTQDAHGTTITCRLESGRYHWQY